MDVCRRLFYAYGLSLAVGIGPSMPTGAVGIDEAVGASSYSGSVYSSIFFTGYYNIACLLCTELFVVNSKKEHMVVVDTHL